MKRITLFLSLISFSIFAFGCENKTTKLMNNTVSSSSNLSNTNEIILSEEYLLGNWQSTEQDWPINLSISKNSTSKKLELNILTVDKGSTKAIFNSKDTNNELWVFLNEDKSIEYRLSIYEDSLLMSMVYVQTDESDEFVPNAIRPWILEKNS